MENYFEAVTDKKHFECEICEIKLTRMANVNFVSNGTSHFKCKHTEILTILNKLDHNQLHLDSSLAAVKTELTRIRILISFRTGHPI